MASPPYEQLRDYARRFSALRDFAEMKCGQETEKLGLKVSDHVIAHVHTSRVVYCQVGLGIFVEMTKSEAASYCERRRKQLSQAAEDEEQRSFQAKAEELASHQRLV